MGAVAERLGLAAAAGGPRALALLAFDNIWRQLRRNRFHHLAFPSRIPGRYSGSGSAAAPAIDATAQGRLAKRRRDDTPDPGAHAARLRIRSSPPPHYTATT